LIFLTAGLAILIAAYFILDTITPGRLGSQLHLSHSAALVTTAWMIAQAAIIFTAIWTNAHGTDLWAALGWTVAFSVIGGFFQVVGFMVLDAVTHGNLGDEVCVEGPTAPLAKVAAANILAIGAIVIASIA
jgi:hypothetical protein